MDVLGNRGLCAQPCRLPYTLIDEEEKKLDKGYLLSPRDLNGIEFLPELIRAGVSCFKIEGRLKSPEYVGIVTRFYRKYIDLVWNNPDLSNDEILKTIFDEINKTNPNTNMTDLEELTQSFNRGGFSKGHLSQDPNQDLIFKEKSNNSGFYLGEIQKFNPNKGYITFKTSYPLSIGDKVGIESDIYTVSELMINNQNIKEARTNDVITIGRMKGNIFPKQKIYKLQSKLLNDSISPTFNEEKEFKKIPLNAKLYIHNNENVKLSISCTDEDSIYYGENVLIKSNIIPSIATTQPVSKEKIITQISKTGNTQFEFKTIDLDMEDNLFIPISCINELRRNALERLQNCIIEKHINSRNLQFVDIINTNNKIKQNNNPKVSLLLNILYETFDYSKLKNIEKIYIPLKYWLNSKFENILKTICSSFKSYIYMPTIIRDTLKIDFNKIINNYSIKGFVISSICQIDMLKNYNLELIGNYTLNVYNSHSITELAKLNIKSLCITPELNDNDAKALISTSCLPLELIVYGRTPLMTMNYCLLGKSNKCYSNCSKLCNSKKKFYIKDRIGLNFRLVPDNFSTITTIYNSKITSFNYTGFNVDLVRISILDEKPNEIQNIIDTVIQNKRFEGPNYCGHFNQSEIK